MKLQYYIFVFLMAIGNGVFAQDIQFKAIASKHELAVNQRFKITFTLNKQGADNFQLPELKHFKLVGGPMNSFSHSNINGKITVQQSYIFFFEPTKQGIVEFPPATVEYEGKTIKSNKLNFDVGKALKKQQNQNNPNSAQSKANENIHLVAELSKTNPYVGEGVYVVYKLYVNNRINAYNPSIMKLPKYDGFWNQEIEIKDRRVKNADYKGQASRYIELKKTFVIPQKSGKLKLEPMDIDLLVEVPTGRVDFFGNRQMTRVKQRITTGTRTVNVKALPTEGKPANFTGAVGEFAYQVSADKTELKANESAKVKVQVSGVGNMKLFELPKITTPEELEVYTPKHKERAYVTSKGLKGEVSDTYTVVPEFKGKYKIPATSFSYFSLEDKEYKTITSNDIVVNMLEGKSLPTVEEETASKQPVIENEAFSPIQTSTVFKAKDNTPFFNSRLFYGLLLLPLLIIPIAVIADRKNEARRLDVAGNKTRRANKLAKKYLSQAKKQLGKKEAFYIALEKALHNYLKGKLQVETTDISNERISELLVQKNVDNETIEAFSNVLSQCNFARYTPTTNLQMQQEYKNATNVLLKLDQQL